MKKLEREKKIDHVRLLMKFKDDYPFTPPFVRIVYPRFKRSTGYIIDGAFCMELLTNQVCDQCTPPTHLVWLLLRGKVRGCFLVVQVAFVACSLRSTLLVCNREANCEGKTSPLKVCKNLWPNAFSGTPKKKRQGGRTSTDNNQVEVVLEENTRRR